MNAYDFILETERETLEFYEHLARHAEERGVRTIFSMMAEDERQFCAMVERWREWNGGMADSPRLDALRKAGPRLDGNAPVRWMNDDLDAYRFIMQVDEERAHFYEIAAAGEQDENARELLRAAALQDHRHHDEVEGVYDFVSAPRYQLACSEFSNLDEFLYFEHRH